MYVYTVSSPTMLELPSDNRFDDRDRTLVRPERISVSVLLLAALGLLWFLGWLFTL